MPRDAISGALQKARGELARLVTERSRVDKEILNWKQVIDSLLAVCDENGENVPADVQVSALGEPSGRMTIRFTDGIRMVLRQSASREFPLSAPQIRDQLVNLGFDFAKYAQPLVPIHNTLKRLEEQGEAVVLRNEMGQALGYRWISPIERALSDDLSLGHSGATGQSIPERVNSAAERSTKARTIHDIRRRQLAQKRQSGSEG